MRQIPPEIEEFRELQAAMIVMPSDVVYDPTFTYIWYLDAGRRSIS